MFNIKKDNIRNFTFILLYKITLDIFYIIFVHKVFGYMGFDLNIDLSKYIVSFLVMFFLFWGLPKGQSKPSTLIMQLHFLLMIIPMFTIYAFIDKSTKFMLSISLVFFIQSALLKLLPNLRIVRIKGSKILLRILIIGMSIFVYSTMIAANGLPSFLALNDSNVYLIRSKVVYPLGMAYFVNWQAQVINPFLIATSFINKKWKLLSISIVMQLILYLITAHKTFLLIPIAILFIMYIVSKYDFLKLTSLTAAVGTFGLLILYQVTKSIYIPSLLIRRLLFVPAHIKFSYFDFFTKNDFLYFSLGMVGKILGLKYPFEKNIALIIGETYYNSSDTWVNTGYLADAFANMGWFGVVIIGLLFVVILKLIDSLSLSIGKSITVGITLFSMLSLNDGSLLTGLLTGGLFFLLVVLYLYTCKSDSIKVTQ